VSAVLEFLVMLVLVLALFSLAAVFAVFIGMCFFKGCQAVANAIRGKKTP
jgi:hypothetical protein